MKACLYCKEQFDETTTQQKYCSLVCSRKYRYHNNYNNHRDKKKKYRDSRKDITSEYNKMYRVKYRDKSIEYAKNYRKNNREKLNKQLRKHYVLHKEDYSKKKKEYKNNNRDKVLKQKRESYYRNREQHLKTCVEYANKRRKADENYKLRHYLTTRIWWAVKSQNTNKHDKFNNLIGCSINELKQYLSKQFKENMSWDNYGDWHIDHIIPCCSFDLTKKEEQQKCFNYKNLQPLWAIDNIKKGGRV